MFFQTVSSQDSDLGIMVNDNMVCRGDGVGGDYNQGTCSAVEELQVGDVVNVKATNGDVLLHDTSSGNINGFMSYIYKAL